VICNQQHPRRSDQYRKSIKYKAVAALVCGGLLGLTAIACYVVRPLAYAAEAKAAPRMFAAYYESWLGGADGDVDDVLAGLPPVVNVVNLSFMRPDARYAGELDFSDTGLEFDYSGRVLKNSIQKLKRRNPNTKVFISVGGEEATNWEQLAPNAIARFVQDFELDGVDLDFEPKSAQCRRVADKIKCASEELLSRTITSLRAALPPTAALSLTAYNTSAYGEDRWKDAQPTGSDTYGMLLGLFRDPAAQSVDFINIMAYDAGSNFNPVEAYEAFQNYFRKPILIGFTPPPEAWGDHAYSYEEIRRVLRATLERGAAGAMLFSLRKLPPGWPENSAHLSPLVHVISTTLTSH
jgi:hypothetical protein